ncbi:MAG: biotin/lipoyl-containing protein [Candidatus Korobacteraceae bacterium]|jgi:biotin carboxyl carrier protein
MPDEHRKLSSEPFVVSNPVKPNEDPLSEPAQTEELRLVAEKIDQAVKLLTEIGEHVAKIAPKQKRIFDDAKMAISDVSLLLRQTPGGAVSGVHRIVAPMPGVILRCDKKIGNMVKKGDLILILDAMKMENLITAPAAGKVVSLPHGEGKKVAKGAVLAVIG